MDSDSTVWDLFADTFPRLGTVPAVRAADAELNYVQLATAVESQAARLRACGVVEGDVVALALPRSAAEIVAVLGVLRMGAVYTAIDPAVPDARMAAMLRVVEPRAVIGRSGHGGSAERIARLTPGGCRWVDSFEPSESPRSFGDPVLITPDSPAYIAFTSGSTGAPKAVRVPHRAVVRLVRGASYLLQGTGERCLRLAPLAFDASTLEIFCPLASGSTLEVFPEGPVAPADLSAFLNDRAVSVAWLTAGLFRLVADEAPHAFSPLRQLVTGGDVVPAGHVRRMLMAHPGLRITNGYGPTENTTFSCTHTVHNASEVEDPLPIGKPVSGTTVLVLDPDGRATPVGEPGELYVGGSGLALDYHRDPGATAQAFTTVAAGPGRFYRTGDLVRSDAEGRLHFLGRNDRQVKLRGFRVELSEIEACLRACPGVQDAVAVIRTGSSGHKHIVAAVTSTAGPELQAAVRAHVRDQLPEAMVPSRVVVVASLPVTANGKLDADVLFSGTETDGRPTEPPEPAVEPALLVPVGLSTATIDYEELIAHVWAEVLGTSDFECDEAFFDVGGDSLTAASVHTALCTMLPDHGIRVVDIFRFPTIEGLAEHLRSGGTS
ncbi:non-ribosomal peptide synthetase [Streptomyces lavendulae]|uniref:non-ribosomal peptide synthetase n=1 Tax=Streptomyces lavendulae TaxID=1914 RepID=UPI002555DA1E|nr:non-ribosomal peptide synthetase [Streptomyces lavendulae]